jgi:outer membrane murein-binding lipoprotein Lpp
MSIAVYLVLAVALTTSFLRSRRTEHALASEVSTLGERVRELQTRVDAAEADVANAVTAGEIAESLLLEKGIADEEEIEAVRRRFGDEEAPAGDERGRNGGELH